MPERSDSAVLKDFSSSFTAQTPLGAIARLGALPEIEPTPAENAVSPPRLEVRPRRRMILWRRVLLVVAIGVGLAVPVSRGGPGATADGDVDAEDLTTTTAGATALGTRAGRHLMEEGGAPAPATAAFARVEDLQLSLPAEEFTRIGYHEASYPNALALTPLGTSTDNQNTTKFTPGEPGDGPDYLVMSSRGRPNPATSAVDIVMHEGTPVASVVSGMVSEVEPYLLYGRHEDTKIEIVPDGRPDLRVVLIHVADVQVAVGDRVEAGRTVLAGSANRFPFSSHIDRYADGTPDPHIHVEVKIPDPTRP